MDKLNIESLSSLRMAKEFVAEHDMKEILPDSNLNGEYLFNS